MECSMKVPWKLYLRMLSRYFVQIEFISFYHLKLKNWNLIDGSFCPYNRQMEERKNIEAGLRVYQ